MFRSNKLYFKVFIAFKLSIVIFLLTSKINFKTDVTHIESPEAEPIECEMKFGDNYLGEQQKTNCVWYCHINNSQQWLAVIDD